MNPAVNSEVEEAASSSGAVKRQYVRSIFSQIAPSYDLLNHLLSFNIDRRWRRQAIEALSWRSEPDGLFVDLCAGTLDVSVQLAAEPGFRGRVLAADFAEPMLRAGLYKRGTLSVDATVADAVELPMGTGIAAGIIVAFGIRNVAMPEAAMAEAVRVLKPGARFVVLEFSTPRNPVARALYHLYFHHVLPRLGRLISGHPTAYHYLPRSVANFPTEERLADLLRGAGFSRVSWTPLLFGIAAIHVAEA